MEKIDLKDSIVKTLTDKLNEIAESVLESVKKEQTDNSSVEKEKVEKVDEKPKVEKSTDTKANEGNVSVMADLVKSLNDVKEEIAALNKKAEPVKAESVLDEKAELQKKQDEIKSSMFELVKSMNIDTDNIEMDFIIKEKKKGSVDDDDAVIVKTKDDDDTVVSETDLEKNLMELEPEERKEALDVYFKNLVYPNSK